MRLSTAFLDRVVFWMIILGGIGTVAVHGGHLLMAAMGHGHAM